MSGVGVVTIAHGRHAHLRSQHLSLAVSTCRPDVYVVVAMDDPELDDRPAHGGLAARVLPIETAPLGLPLAAARNRGIDAAFEAGCDVVIALDVDCLASPDLVADYCRLVSTSPDTVWQGPVTYLPPPPAGGYSLATLADLDDPHPARPRLERGETRGDARPELFWSLSFALSGSSWRRSGGFCEEYVGYGGEDTDFGQSLRAAGIDLSWTGDARAYHQYHPVSRPPIEHLDDILRNAKIYERRWGTWPMGGWLEEFERRGLIVWQQDSWVRATC
ncbi:glycosyltransferase family 2 protein [Nocardioides conyzicola]|uniref:Glycosyltransferase n=1 Tax=Nocardioides conyzicola TaxID=1651781 RepID=A0ABP8Y1J3_9ACTN